MMPMKRQFMLLVGLGLLLSAFLFNMMRAPKGPDFTIEMTRFTSLRNETQDLFISYLDRNLAALCPILTSLLRTNFTGDIVILHASSNANEIQAIHQRFPTVQFVHQRALVPAKTPSSEPVVHRFLAMYMYLFIYGYDTPLDPNDLRLISAIYPPNNNSSSNQGGIPFDFAMRRRRKPKYRYVMTQDASDSIYQSNPSDFLQEHLGHSIERYGRSLNLIAASEGLTYDKETEWGLENLHESYPYLATHVEQKMIMNAGTIAGTQQRVMDVMFTDYFMSRASSLSNPDQAAYNAMMWYLSFGDEVLFTQACSGWGTMLGTVGQSKFKDQLFRWRPVVWRDRRVLVECKEKPEGWVAPVIIHQYNRDPELMKAIKEDTQC